MSPRHFANYAKNNPTEYQTFADTMWNSFVTVTHTIGLNRFFTFTPDFLGSETNNTSGHFQPGEIPGDQASSDTKPL